jgi:ElaB/YqjD/DUF883 family membrane-anchored ribosome-binding protein
MEQMQSERIPSSVQEIPGATETYQQARAMARDAAQYTDEVVRQNPWTSVGVGFGAGVLIGVLAAMCMRSGHLR